MFIRKVFAFPSTTQRQKHMATTEPIRTTNTIKIAEEARDELRTALTAVGIKLPT